MGRLLAALLGLALSAACTSGPTGSFGPDAPPTGPLTALAECGPLPDPTGPTEVEGLELPDGAVVTDVYDAGELVHVTAQVPLTPVSIRVAYEEAHAAGTVEVLSAEDEIFESELLVSDGEHRFYVKASAICQTGSAVLAILAPEIEALPALPSAAPSPTG